MHMKYNEMLKIKTVVSNIFDLWQSMSCLVMFQIRCLAAASSAIKGAWFSILTIRITDLIFHQKQRLKKNPNDTICAAEPWIFLIPTPKMYILTLWSGLDPWNGSQWTKLPSYKVVKTSSICTRSKNAYTFKCIFYFSKILNTDFYSFMY